MVEMSPRSFQFPHLVIRFADPAFFALFNYEPANFPLQFEELLADGNLRHTTHSIERAIVKGRTCTYYTNLKQKNGAVLSCHITIISICPSNRLSSRETFNSPASKIAQVTIRSASVIGNTKQLGLGVLGTFQVPQQALNNIIGRPRG